MSKVVIPEVKAKIMAEDIRRHDHGEKHAASQRSQAFAGHMQQAHLATQEQHRTLRAKNKLQQVNSGKSLVPTSASAKALTTKKAQQTALGTSKYSASQLQKVQMAVLMSTMHPSTAGSPGDDDSDDNS